MEVTEQTPRAYDGQPATEHIPRSYSGGAGPIYPERDSELWRRAWAALIATGRDPGAGWMLMHAEGADVPGGYRFAFKNHSLCEPVMAGDPAYDGRTKYIHLPT